MELQNMIDFVLWLKKNLKTTDENALNERCWEMTCKYANFLNIEISKEMVLGEDRFFTLDAKYNDYQPSTRWNNISIAGFKVIEATNTNPYALLGVKIKDLTHLGLKLSEKGYQYFENMPV